MTWHTRFRVVIVENDVYQASSIWDDLINEANDAGIPEEQFYKPQRYRVMEQFARHLPYFCERDKFPHLWLLDLLDVSATKLSRASMAERIVNSRIPLLGRLSVDIENKATQLHCKSFVFVISKYRTYFGKDSDEDKAITQALLEFVQPCNILHKLEDAYLFSAAIHALKEIPG